MVTRVFGGTLPVLPAVVVVVVVVVVIVLCYRT